MTTEHLDPRRWVTLGITESFVLDEPLDVEPSLID